MCHFLSVINVDPHKGLGWLALTDLLCHPRVPTPIQIHPRTTNSPHVAFTNALTHPLIRWLRLGRFHISNTPKMMNTSNAFAKRACFQHMLSVESCKRAHVHTGDSFATTTRHEHGNVAQHVFAQVAGCHEACEEKHVGRHVRTTNECRIPILHANTDKQKYTRRRHWHLEEENKTSVKEKNKQAWRRKTNMREGENKHAWKKHMREQTNMRENKTCVKDKMQRARGRTCNMREGENVTCLKNMQRAWWRKCNVREGQMQHAWGINTTRVTEYAACARENAPRVMQHATCVRGKHTCDHASHLLPHAHMDMTRTTRTTTQHNITTTSCANTTHAIVEINNMRQQMH